MTATFRLFWIEARRSTAIWFVPLALAITWYVARESHAHGVTLWAKKSAQAGQVLIVLGPLIGGLAAWIAARDRRRGIEDLLKTTPRPPTTRDLAGYLSTIAWGLLAYLVAVAGVFVVTARAATWGSPDWFPVGIGLATITVGAAAGYAVGLCVPSRFTTAVVPIALVLALLVPGNYGYESNTQFLTPWTFVDPGDYDPFYDAWPNVAAPLFTWLLGLLGIALVAIVLHRRRKLLILVVLLGAILTTSVAGIGLHGTGPEGWSTESRTSYEPLCRDEASTTVCVHPAYANRLDDAASLVGKLLGPIVGLPGVPNRVEQVLYSRDEPPDGTIYASFYNWIYNGDWGRAFDAENILQQVICESGCDAYDPESGYYFSGAARSVVGVWLLQQAGGEPSLMLPPRPGQEHIREQLAEALERFAALDPAARQAWFEEQFADLRAGRLTLEDLP